MQNKIRLWRPTAPMLWAIGLLMAWVCWNPHAHAAPPGPGEAVVITESVSTDKQLVQRSELVVRGRIGGRVASYPTGRKEGSRQVLHYVQPIEVIETFKGDPRETVKLLTSGVEPLPDAGDPLNRTYTGPLEEGEYICFLRRSPGTDLFTLTGLWQGLYPVYNGKSIALLPNGGFPSFNDLPVAQFKSKAQALAEQP